MVESRDAMDYTNAMVRRRSKIRIEIYKQDKNIRGESKKVYIYNINKVKPYGQY